jgi:predicted DNA-binding transcriptional regulator YafY
MTDTTLRYVRMLDCLPTEPRKTTAKDIHARLTEAGFATSVRTVERDLDKLAEVFPIQKDERSRPYGWSWLRDAARVDIQPIDRVSAVTLLLARDHLAPLLPDSVIRVLAPRFEAAARLLAGEDHDLARLPARIRVKSRGQRLALPVVDHAVLEALYDALQHARHVRITYAARKNEGKPRRYGADPLGLVFVDGVVYFVCRLHSDETRIAHLPVQRIRAVEDSGEAAQEPAGFDLDRFVEDTFDYPVGNRPLKLSFRMDRLTAAHLEERPLAKDQRIEADAAGATVTVQATVADTQQLRWWLLGFGDKVEVLGPAGLRAEFAALAARLAARYGQAAGN